MNLAFTDREAVRGADSALGRITRQIRAEGPMSVAAFMATALHDSRHGYYHRREPIGGAGDFITAPEISQCFGEMIGLWCADLWMRMGSPDPVILAELGPGNGVLMRDLLRAAGTVPAFRKALRLHLVELSPLLRQRQRAQLPESGPVWLDSAADLPPGPMILVANEFLDALPIRLFVRGVSAWRERLVCLDAAEALILADGPESPGLGLLVPEPYREAPEGTICEICPAALSLVGMLAARFERVPGAALLVDYGYAVPTGGATLQGVRNHRPVGILDEPGATDLSALVDFGAVADAACRAGAATYGPVAQGDFLQALGIGSRLKQLQARGTPEQQSLLASGVRRLIDPGEMGTLFKVLAFTARSVPQPAGFPAFGAATAQREAPQHAA